MIKILCVGEALIDMICTEKGKSLSEGQNFLKKTGGAPTNVAAAIAALGGQVELAAKVGDDAFGRQLIETMQDFGIDTRLMFQDQAAFTTFAFVSLMENGERDFVFNRGADGELSIQDIDQIDLNEFGMIHFGSATGFLEGKLQDAYKELLERALRHHLFVSFDPNYRHLLFKNNTKSFIEQAWYFLESCHFFKVSDEEAVLITATNSLDEAVNYLLKKTQTTFAITLGKDGTMLGYKGKMYLIPSIPIKPVDTTGAGDAFVGAVLYQISEKKSEEIAEMRLEDWEKIIFNANKAGARTCEYLGAMEAFKHLSIDIFK
jgi:fructokinase